MMQVPQWARKMQEQAGLKKPTTRVAGQNFGPTLRDDAWWHERVAEFRRKHPERTLPQGKLRFWLELDVEQRPNDGNPDIPVNADHILERWIEGEDFTALGEYLTELLGFPVSGAALRSAITASAVGRAKYTEARKHRAHREVELAREDAGKAARAGDYRFAAEFRLKLAGKMLPEEYGDKSQIEVGGISGKPVEHTVKQSPAEAYKAVLAGGIIGGLKE